MTLLKSVCAIVFLSATACVAQLPADCGFASANGQAFIINGKNSSIAEFPWHAGLYIKSRNFQQVCGGSLVHPRIVLTAAHCLYEDAQYGKPWRAGDLKASVGSSIREWTDLDPQAQRRNVSRVFPHPQYRGRGRNFADDIALLELESPITINAYVVPVCVDWKNKEVPALTPDDVGKAVGWGLTGNREPSPVLQSAELPFIPFDKCAEAVPQEFLPFLTNDKFCAGNINGATVSQGDSGGGLAFKVHGQWYVQGVVSVGVPDKLSYTAFTRISTFLEWLNDILSNVLQAEILPAAGVRWVSVSKRDGPLPANAIKAGYQRNGDRDNPHYVGRLWHANSIIPATVANYGKWTAFAAWDGKSTPSSDTFEVAVAEEDRVQWVAATNGVVPDGAVKAGVAANGNTLYACRAFDNDRHRGDHYIKMTPGVLRPGTAACSVEFYGVNNYSTYEVLVIAARPRPCKVELNNKGVRWQSISRSGGALPANAIKAGYQRNGDNDNPHYVGRLWHANSIIPATVTNYGKWTAFAAWDGKSTPSTDTFEVAVADEETLRWVPSANGAVPEGAVKGGLGAQGETLYVCRVFDANRSNGKHFLKMTPGVLRPSSRACSVEFYGAHNYPTYEVLVSVSSLLKC